jgi:hypothetical protein
LRELTRIEAEKPIHWPQKGTKGAKTERWELGPITGGQKLEKGKLALILAFSPQEKECVAGPVGNARAALTEPAWDGA